ncbi:cysteine-rich secretory protein-related [Holotrichia oblita]|uniref:Cysteine-rich secretory protein-related n=1 Tax=Holotrichia oblita TaxID=644536 RepID=A0ACB9TZ43_HOLOL|nr:cysteine-rich secretory protein-related [Holotrichia oblita]
MNEMQNPTYKLAIKFDKAILSSCNDLIHERFSNNSNDIQTIVNRHNFYRQAIMDGKVPGQLMGVDLKYLKWDYRLAEMAQGTADMCEFKQRNLYDPRFRLGLGQNIARSKKVKFISNDANWTAIVEIWFNEYKQYNYKKQSPSDASTSSYTQIVWADTELIGCGFNSHDNPEMNSEYAIEETYICLYGPRGNLIGIYPYALAPQNEEQKVVDYEL